MMSTDVAVLQANAALSVEQFKQVLPEKMRKSVSVEVLNTLNQMLAEPDMCEAYRDNLIGYTSVMNDGKFKLESYVLAVKYVSFKLMGCTNIDAFSKTFPDKISRWTAQGVASKDMASYVTSYNKSKLVNLILEQTLIPTHVLNADVYQKAINVQVELMTSATSEKVRCDAANSLLTHLKAPEKTKLQIDLNVGGGDNIAALRENVAALRDVQLQLIQSGQMTVQQVAERKMSFTEIEDGQVVN